MRTVLWAALVWAAHGTAHAQLSGIYTVGGTAPDYASISDALADLMAQGVSAPVEMAIRPGVYNEQLHIMAIPGASATNRVTFRSEGYDSASVTVSFQFVVNWETLLRLDNVSYIDMMHMTFRSTGSVPHYLGQIFNGSHHNRIMNCKLEGTDLTHTLLYSTNTCDSANTVMNNLLLGAGVGVHFEGYFSNYEKNNRIIGNVCLGQKGIGIRIRSQISQTVVGNEVHIVSVSPASPFVQGIDTGISTGTTEVSHNRVTIELDSATHVMGIYCASLQGAPNNLVKIYNNTVDVRVLVLDSVGDGIKGIEFKHQLKFIDLAHNSVRVEAYSGTVADKSQALVYPSSFSGRIYNNIFANMSGGQIGAVAVRVLPTSPATVETLAMDYNDLYSEGSHLIDRLGTTFPDLSTWQQATGNDMNSVSIDPQFTDSLLHLPCNSPLTGAGLLLSAVPQDIDGITRNDPPTIGAYELNPSGPLWPYTDTLLCNGQTMTLAPHGKWDSYEWQDGSTAPTFTVTQSGQYWVRVYDACYQLSDTMMVTYIPPPLVSLGNDTSLCLSQTLLLNAYTDSATFLWQDGITESFFTITQAGTYHVEVENQCGEDTDTVTVTYISPPSIDLGSDTLLCDGQTITLTASADSAAYLWQDGSTGSTFTVTQAGTYHVEVENQCGADTDTVTVTYITPPSIDFGPDILLCDGQTITLTAAADSATYQWQNGSTENTLIVTQAGTYDVEVTNQCGTDTDTMEVLYLSPPSIDLGNDTLLCPGETLLLNAATDSATYLWQDGSTESFFTVIETGTYHVEVVNQCGPDTDTVTVTYITPPSIDLGSDTLLCDGQTITLTAAADSANYQWQDGSMGSTFSVTQADTYHVTVMNQCGMDMDTVEVLYLSPPSIGLGSDTLLCPNETLLLSAATDSATYLWQDGSTESFFTVIETGSYHVEVENQCGADTDTVTVTYISPPSIDLGPDTIICMGDTLVLVALGEGLLFQWQDGSAGATFSVTDEGIFWAIAPHPCGMVGDTVHIAMLDCDTLPKPLELTNIITPNGDGHNDALVFGNLPPGSSLTIYSRWGRRILLAPNYLNDWRADGVADGTYFYVLALPSGEAVKGYVTVVRE